MSDEPVKRYSTTPYGVVEQDRNGNLVTFSDFERLRAEEQEANRMREFYEKCCEDLQAKNERLKAIASELEANPPPTPEQWQSMNAELLQAQRDLATAHAALKVARDALAGWPNSTKALAAIDAVLNKGGV